MNKTVISSIIALAAIVGIGYLVVKSPNSTSATRSAETVVAKVNSDQITQAELTAAMDIAAQAQGTTTAALNASQKATLQTQALDNLIANTLIKQAVIDAGITASSTAVDAQLEIIKKRFPTQTAYVDALNQEKLTEAKLRQQIEQQLKTEQYINSKLNLSAITVTNAEIEAYYQKSIIGSANFPQLSEVRDQVKAMVLEEKQREKVLKHIEELRSKSRVEVLI